MSKYTEIYAPVSGVTKDVTKVEDPVFAQKLVGDGVAIIPSNNIIKAPCTGKLNHVFSTNHAFTILNENNIEILVHLGIDTIELDGKGFKRLVDKNKEFVNVGEPLIEMDLDYIISQDKKTDIIVIISDSDSNYKIKKKINKKISYQDEIFKFFVK